MCCSNFLIIMKMCSEPTFDLNAVCCPWLCHSIFVLFCICILFNFSSCHKINFSNLCAKLWKASEKQPCVVRQRWKIFWNIPVKINSFWVTVYLRRKRFHSACRESWNVKKRLTTNITGHLLFLVHFIVTAQTFNFKF